MMLFMDVYLKRKNHCLSFSADMNSGITGLFGPSGAGKTTLLHILAGLTKPDSGMIAHDGRILYDSEKGINIPTHKRNIGLVFQDHLLFPHLNVRQNLMFGQSQKKVVDNDALTYIARILDIHMLLKHSIHELSGGEKQRVALGRAILGQPELLLLDEPFAGLDYQLKQQVIAYLKQLHRSTKIPMILVSHTPEDLSDLVDELFFIEQGQLFARGKMTKNNQEHPYPRLCDTENPQNFRNMRNILIKNHSMKCNANSFDTNQVFG